MKTTKDGHEAIKGQYYYLENGQSVILDEYAITPDSQPVFLVTPFYEGETMTVNGDGGHHNEITAEYEHEGEQTLVKAIFKKAPTEKLDETYRTKLCRIESLSIAFGETKKHLDKLSIEKLNIERLTKALSISCEKSKENDLQARNMLDSTTDLVNKKRQELSGLEDSVSTLKNKDFSSLIIGKEELQRLNKRDFELQCLENGGVDNWEWYSESLKDFNERYPES